MAENKLYSKRNFLQQIFFNKKFIHSDPMESIIRRIYSKFDREKELDINRFNL